MKITYESKKQEHGLVAGDEQPVGDPELLTWMMRIAPCLFRVTESDDESFTIERIKREDRANI